MSFALIAAVLLHAAPPAQQQAAEPLRGARAPAYAPDGRLAVSIDGDLFVQQAASKKWVQITSGAAWDRDPEWSRDGSHIYYSSNEGGSFSIWRMAISADGLNDHPQRITVSRFDDSAPSVEPNGSVAFVRGFGGSARIWIRDASGSERRLTNREESELAPEYSPDGSSIAYIQVFETGRRLLIRNIASERDGVAVAARMPESLAWAPDGSRIAFSASAGNGERAGTFVVAANAMYTNYATAQRGEIAWSPDGQTLAIVEVDDSQPGYNGDPARLGDRAVREPFGKRFPLMLVTAPTAPDVGLRETAIDASRPAAGRNTAVFEQVWERSAKLYYSGADASDRLKQWTALREKYRAQAATAKDDEELQRVMFRMNRERPLLRQPATGRAAVSSAHPVATAAGLEILAAGGNVVDAAAAVSFALGVVEPDASGPGGYGQMVIALAKVGTPKLIEFMTRVPEDAGLDNTSLLVDGSYPSDGPVLTNVPGTIAGMYSAFKQYGSGKVSWKDIVAPAIRAARDGYEVSDGLATTLQTEREHFAKYESSTKLFFRNGNPVVAGDTVKNPDLAWTLEQVAERGADGFYRGVVAERYANDLHAKGNAMKVSDLNRYFAVDREPVSGTYRGFTLYSSAPPVSGGADLVGKFNLLELAGSQKIYTENAATLHATLASWSLVRRGQVADPAFWPVNIVPQTSKDTARIRWSCFSPDRAVRTAELPADSLGCSKPADDALGSSVQPHFEQIADAMEERGCGAEHAAEVTYCHASGTTAFVVADNEGNAVSVTQTLGTWGGTFYVSPGLGFISNDKLTSYGTNPTSYGSRLPFARHGSTISPTVVMRAGKPVFAVGAAGNAWITSGVYQILLGLMDYGLSPQQALELPRFLPGGGGGGGGAFVPTEPPPLPTGRAGNAGSGRGGRGAGGRGAVGRGGRGATPGPVMVQIEDGFSPDVLKRMREMGYDFTFVSLMGELREGYGAAVSIDGKKVTAGADPRRAGAAGAIP
ncbi:MAG: gamma-glutamyltransferase [Gemmatimonadetes bacterium]|nr:gamma-glutamyltransferase [Gemmatimonadota bacterium]